MTLQEFISKNNGKKLDFDGAYQNQCMDLYRFYVRDVWGLPQTPGVVGAYQVFDSLPKTFEKVTMGEILPGDVMVWDERLTKNGHIAVVVEAQKDGVWVFQQNAPKAFDPCNTAWYPYKYIKGWFRPKKELQKTFMKVTLVANKIAWDVKPHLATVSEWFKKYSNNKLEIVFDVKQTNFDSIPLMPFLDNQAVNINWYRDNITPLGTGEATVLLMNYAEYPVNGSFGFMTWGDTNKPVRMEVMCGNEASDINFPEAHLVVHRIFHEICHSLYFLAGQQDISHTNPSQPRVHELLYVPEPQLPANRAILLNEIDYRALQAKLALIKPSPKIKIRQVGWNDPEKGLYIPFDNLQTRAMVLAKINEVLPLYELDNVKEFNLGKRPF